MVERRNTNMIHAAICSALAAGALTCASAMAHDVTSTGGQTADADQASRANSTADTSKQRDGAVVWYVMPVTLQSQSDEMSKGCWVRMYSGDDFEGRVLSIVGPASMYEMLSPYGTGMNNWESAVVGPNATVTTYDDENFRSRNAVLKAGQRYPDLDDSKLGLFDDIESMKVECKRSP